MIVYNHRFALGTTAGKYDSDHPYPNILSFTSKYDKYNLDLYTYRFRFVKNRAFSLKLSLFKSEIEF